jgi:hypothetical protein
MSESLIDFDTSQIPDLENKLKSYFIADELAGHGDYLTDLLTAAVDNKNLINTGELEGSFTYSVIKVGGNWTLRVSFAEQGRLIEIAFFKKRKSAWSVIDERKVMWGIVDKEKRKKRKDTRFYSANAYGSLNRLIGRISYCYSESVRQSFIEAIKRNPAMTWDKTGKYW